MSAGIYRMTCEQGATFERVFSVSDEAGDPVNFHGYSARMQVRPETDSSEIYLELTTENGRIQLVDNIVTVRIDADDTATIPEDGVYDLELISPIGDVTRFLKGTFKLDHEVTR